MAIRGAVRKEYGLSAAALKWMAAAAMITDHFAAAVYRQTAGYDPVAYEVMRKIGRIAFPIYCFLLVEGFFRTGNVKGYIRNCLVFAFLSEIPFDMAIFGQTVYPYRQNVYFTLSIGLCALAVLDRFRYRYGPGVLFARLAVAGLAAYAGEVFGVDYRWRGVLFIIMFYYTRDLQAWIGNVVGVCAFAYGITAPLAFIPINLYNGMRGRQAKYLFYAIYPVHLLIFGLIRFYLDGD